MESIYDPKAVERKWQERWLAEKTFAANDSDPKEHMYVLDMFPYPSGDGLHVGHVKIYTASDIVARYLRMKGFSVLHPTGWDAFGLPTENTAIKKGIHPAILTKQNVDRFRGQMQAMGLSYDWDREINTSDPNYYKWTQWIFVRLFKMGLAYEATVPINWCPSCKTGLANEEVVDGKCERCGHEVELKDMRQWMLRITKYADRLLAGLGGLEWPTFVKELQTNWIGKSEGTAITFQVQNPSSQQQEQLTVFTTRPDTLFGATYVVLSPNHPMAKTLTVPEQQQAVDAYIQEAAKPVRIQEHEEKEKTGVFTGSFAVNPINGEQIPIWIADYVLMDYGSGAIMAVPAHDERDFEFATKYQLPMKQVVAPADGEVELPYTGEGVLINSGPFDGQTVQQAREQITGKLKQDGVGKATTKYKLRDWVFSRQRYWGEPIPIIHCEKCGTVPVPEEQLPVLLPEIDSFEPTGTGQSPLAAVEDWVNVKCPTCPNMARRETNTMPQWAGSSWYWLRYVSPRFREGVADPSAMKTWLPVDVYVGGAEHAVLHLMYARFWQMALKDAGVVQDEEPFKRFYAVGLVMGEDGQKMSKSRGNVINPDDVVETFGADALRLYEMFMGPFEHSVAWDTNSIKGARRFLDRAWALVSAHENVEGAVDSEEVELALHKTIRRASEGTENFKFNTVIAALMELINILEKQTTISHETLESFVLMLAPYAPHIAEELWQILGHADSVSLAPWPKENTALLERATITIPVQVNGKVRGELQISPGVPQDQAKEAAQELDLVQKHLAGKEIVKVIYVPDRLINFVVKGS